jgi:hypothetical protein
MTVKKLNTRTPAQRGNHARNKGARAERAILEKLHSLGLEAQRVPLSGAAHGLYAGDINIEDGTLIAEVKARASGGGFKTISNWIGMDDPDGPHDLLILREDRSDPLVVLTWECFSRFVRTATEAKLFRGEGLLASSTKSRRVRGRPKRRKAV